MLGSSFQDNLVHIAVESFVGKIGKLFDVRPVVVHLVRALAESVILRIIVGQDTGTAGVQPEAWILLGVTSEYTLSNGSGRSLMIRSIRSVLASQLYPSVTRCRNLRRTMSAFEACSLIKSELSRSPITTFTRGYFSLTSLAFSSVLIRTVQW